MLRQLARISLICFAECGGTSKVPSCCGERSQLVLALIHQEQESKNGIAAAEVEIDVGITYPRKMSINSFKLPLTSPFSRNNIVLAKQT